MRYSELIMGSYHSTLPQGMWGDSDLPCESGADRAYDRCFPRPRNRFRDP